MMNYLKIAVWFSIGGLTLGMLLYGVAVGDQPKNLVQERVKGKNMKPDTAVRIVQAQSTKPATAPGMPQYKPPKRGAPTGRVAGGTRGPGREVFVFSVLAPDHTGLTISEQPSLYWFISSSTTLPVELTVMDPQATKPILETRIPLPIQPGVHRIRLADHGVRLSPRVPYRWSVAVVPDTDRRSKDILAGGAIERIELQEGLSAKLAQEGKTKAPHIFAEAGLWYDALAALSDLIDAAPNNTVLRKQRASLMEQVGLPEIAEYEMKHTVTGGQ